MSFSPLLLVVFAACLHATWNILAKKAAALGSIFVFAYTLCAAIIFTPATIWILYYFYQDITWIVAFAIVISALSRLTYTLSLQIGYKKADLSIVYPIARGTGPLLSTFGAFIFLREPATLTGLIGMLMIVSGIVLIAADGHLSTLFSTRARVGLQWGIQTGLMIAAYSVIDAYSVKILMISPILLESVDSILRTIVLLPFALRSKQLPLMKGYWHYAILVGVISPISYISILYALSLGASLSVVAPMREMSIMIGTLYGLFILKEAGTFWRIGGSALLILGVLLLSFGL